MKITFPGWATARGLVKLDGEWCKVTSLTGRTREGHLRVDHDGSVIVTDDNGDAFIFDRDDIDAIEVS